MGKLKFGGVSPQVGMDLLSVFWNRQHAAGSIVYRPCFMRDMASQGRYFSELLLNAMFFVATKHRLSMGRGAGSVADINRAGIGFLRRLESILCDPSSQVLCNSSITTVQALLLMSDCLFSWCDQRSLSWHYLGIAINMIFDLGIHSETSMLRCGQLEAAEDLETRRRVFWAAFSTLR